MASALRVLVTGASGLVGGRLLEHLLTRGTTTVRAASRVARRWPVGVEGVVMNGAPGTLDAACRDVDAVINLASLPEPEAAADPSAALRVTAGGTLALASAAAKAGVRRFVQLSTYKVYSNSPGGIVIEETPARPRSHYAIVHRTAEDYATFVHPNAVVFRLANGFGAPAGVETDRWGIIINQMCRQAATERRITINSSGRASRNFVPMPDIVRALEAGAGGLPAGVYNLGSWRSMTLKEAADVVARVCESIFGFAPLVTTGAAAAGERDADALLDFRVDKLAAAGCPPSASFDAAFEAEVARTLVAALQHVPAAHA